MNNYTDESSSGTSHSLKRVAIWSALFLCLFVLGGISWLSIYWVSPGPDMESESVVVDIPKGASLKKITSILGDAGVINDDIRFLLIARARGVAGRLQAGEFSLPTGRVPTEIMDLLVSAKPLQHAITVPEGLRGTEIAQLFADRGWCEEDAFKTLIVDPAFIKQLGLEGLSSLEGYLYPDTYFLTKEMRNARYIIEMMVNRFHDVWQSIVSEIEINIDKHDTVILASIVEKETGRGEERPIIASVFHNRLKKRMRLQSDPTVTYLIEDFTGPITKKMLRDRNPYNTYVISGLPAGPIANPGKAAMEAVLFPASTNYLYFVAKNDGTHLFSTNLRDHNRGVQKYQRKKKSKNGKE